MKARKTEFGTMEVLDPVHDHMARRLEVGSQRAEFRVLYNI